MGALPQAADSAEAVKIRSRRVKKATSGKQASSGRKRDIAKGFKFFRTMGGETVLAKHAFITAHKTSYSIRCMCRVLGISASWFHAWRKTEDTRQGKAAHDLNLVSEIRCVIRENKSCYGSLRVFHKLVQEGVECTAYRVRKLMKLHNIRQP
jgi:helix-turn-helix protein